MFYTLIEHSLFPNKLLVQKSKETKQYDDPGKSIKLSSFKIKKKWGGFNLIYPQGKQIHYDKMEVYNRFKP